MCFNPDGRTITGDSNGDIILWTLPAPTYSVQNVIPNAHPGGVFALAATPDGLVSGGGKDYRVRLFDWDFVVRVCFFRALAGAGGGGEDLALHRRHLFSLLAPLSSISLGPPTAAVSGRGQRGQHA